MDLLERAKTLLQATYDLLQKQDDSHYVLNLLCETVHYDDADCDGSCLKDDIDFWFDELEQTKQKIVSLDKVKQAREEINKLDTKTAIRDTPQGRESYFIVDQVEVLKIIDKLIAESEEQNA